MFAEKSWSALSMRAKKVHFRPSFEKEEKKNAANKDQCRWKNKKNAFKKKSHITCRHIYWFQLAFRSFYHVLGRFNLILPLNAAEEKKRTISNWCHTCKCLCVYLYQLKFKKTPFFSCPSLDKSLEASSVFCHTLSWF